MDIKWLKTFIIAAENENFRKTAEELFLTQPAVTKHVRRLEDHLNVELFERTGKAIVLTPAGIKFLAYARKIISSFDQGLNEFESWKQGYNRKLIIATAPQIASSILPSILRGFIDRNPDIEVLLNILNSYEIGEEISAGRADIGLTRIKPFQTNIISEKAHEESVILTGPYFEEKKDQFNEKLVLQKYRLITHNHPEYWENLLNEIKRNYPTVKTMQVNQIEITKRLIEQGLGVSYLPISMVKEELKRKKLLEIKADRITMPTSSTYILTKAATYETQAFSEFFKENLSKL